MNPWDVEMWGFIIGVKLDQRYPRSIGDRAEGLPRRIDVITSGISLFLSFFNSRLALSILVHYGTAQP